MLQIYTYGNPVLRVKAAPVANIDSGVKKLAAGMVELMLQKNGVGLAAQQVGQAARIFVMHVPVQYDLDKPAGNRLNPEINAPLVIINPVLLEKKGRQLDKEGCLSIPDIFVPVQRAYEVSLSCLDVHGKERRITLRGLMARVVQHETDHLDGILFVDRISAIKKISISARLKKIKRAAEEKTSSD